MPKLPKLSNCRPSSQHHRREHAIKEASAQPSDPTVCQTPAPPEAIGSSLVPVNVESAYTEWPRLPDLLPASFPGVKPHRDDFLVAIDRADLARRMADYSRPGISDQEIAHRYPGAMDSTDRYDARAVRAEMLEHGAGYGFIKRYCYRAFDLRWVYWAPDTRLLDEERPDYFDQAYHHNLWLEARQKQTEGKFARGYVTTALADTLGDGCSNFFPLLVRDAAILGGTPGEPRPNLSPAARAYLACFGTDADAVPPDSLFFHAVATLHAPAYRTENAGALRQDWPRIPLPADRDPLLASAALGRRVAALLDPETPVPGVTTGPLPEDLRRVAVLTKTGREPLDPATDLAVTAGWGHFGQGGAVMPGRGRVEMPLVDPSQDHVERLLAADAAGLPGPHFEYHPCLVYLNDTVFWNGVPRDVWEYTLGGYPVLKKWLSYRESSVLGRPLRPEEAREFTAIARRIAARLALGPDLDAAYRAAATGAANPVTHDLPRDCPWQSTRGGSR